MDYENDNYKTKALELLDVMASAPFRGLQNIGFQLPQQHAEALRKILLRHCPPDLLPHPNMKTERRLRVAFDSYPTIVTEMMVENASRELLMMDPNTWETT